ncbi:MAG: hypothetical protein R2794_02080 [Chitinophagales bacterium]
MKIFNFRMRIFIFGFAIQIIYGCGSVPMVHKSRIVFDEAGYLLIWDERSIFIPFADSTYCFEKVLKKGQNYCYELNEISDKEQSGLNRIATDLIVLSKDSSGNKVDTIKMLYCAVRGFPYANFRNTINTTFEFECSNQKIRLSPANFNYQIIYLRPILISDISAYKKYLIEGK